MREQPKAPDATKAMMPEINMANPQVTREDVAWLAGIWDGEGSIGVRRNLASRQFSPRVSMVNTNAVLIARVCEILDAHRISYSVAEKGRGGFPGSHKQCWIVGIQTLRGAHRFLHAFGGYLVGKRAQAQLLLRFVESRLRRRMAESRNSDAPYNEDELTTLSDLYRLNGDQRGTSETIRAPRADVSEMR